MENNQKCLFYRQNVDLNQLLKTEMYVTLISENNHIVFSEVVTERPIIKVKYPKCFHEGLYFSTTQLRNANESQIVFYECSECSHRYSLNS
jgi:DNA-directed RNA polymerase subunit M/transcription elongation factor TFIIS